MMGEIAAAVKIHCHGGSFLLKSFAAAIGAEDQERNGPLDATAAAEIGIMRRTRSWRCSGTIHLFILGVWMFICTPVVFGLKGVRRDARTDEFFPDLFFFQPGPQ